MKKIKTNKLSLSTETLAPLTGADLDAVAGGNASLTLTATVGPLTTVITRTFAACPTIAAVCAAGK